MDSLRKKVTVALLGGLILTTAAFGQNGDKEGESQAALDPSLVIPPAPVLSPEEGLASITVEDGYRVELVASEPLIHDPVEIEWDADGRLWVVEMRGYMPNADGTGEDVRNGRVVVLEDVDDDGRMDKSTVFARDLLMPRAIAPVYGGVLIAEPPNLWFFEDTDGDLIADKKTIVTDDYGNQTNPEHTANALMWGLDNWIYSANHTVRYRLKDGKWESQDTIFRGQWGQTHDDWGRPFYNTNSDQLRGDLLPAEYLTRNPGITRPYGFGVRITTDQRVWPSRVTPGINRGYRNGMLRDGKLTKFTGACGPVIYRGDVMPDLAGNAFVPEPAGNLIKRNILSEDDGIISASFAYENREFLTSSDERFRPVNMVNGPDGSLYVVDFYRGIVQHRIYMTTFLRKQVDERKLASPVGLGRIYRVTKADAIRRPTKKLSQLSSADLVLELQSDNGWTRDKAQQTLVERQAQEVAPFLRALAQKADSPIVRNHALWTLEGLGAAQVEDVQAAIESDHPKLVRTGLRLAEDFLSYPTGWRLLPAIDSAVRHGGAEIAAQAAASLSAMKSDSSLQFLGQIAGKQASHPLVRDALLTGAKGSEVGLIKVLWDNLEGSPSSEHSNFVQALAKSVYASKSPEQIVAALDLAAKASEHGTAYQDILKGMVSARPSGRRGQAPPKITPIVLPPSVPAWETLKDLDHAETQQLIGSLETMITLASESRSEAPSSASGGQSPAAPRALTSAEQTLFDLGKQLYTATCAACHQPHGNGQPGLAPPLRGSEWLSSPDERLARIVLQGVAGPITVMGEEYNLAMPGLPVFSDDQLAGILTYVRRAWEGTGAPVAPSIIAKVRKETEGRFDMWTEDELLEIN